MRCNSGKQQRAWQAIENSEPCLLLHKKTNHRGTEDARRRKRLLLRASSVSQCLCGLSSREAAFSLNSNYFTLDRSFTTGVYWRRGWGFSRPNSLIFSGKDRIRAGNESPTSEAARDSPPRAAGGIAGSTTSIERPLARSASVLLQRRERNPLFDCVWCVLPSRSWREGLPCRLQSVSQGAV